MFDPLSLLLNDSWKKIRNVYKTLSEQFLLVCGTNETGEKEDRDGHTLFCECVCGSASKDVCIFRFVSIFSHDLQNHIKSLKIMETYASSCYGRWTLIHTQISRYHELHQKYRFSFIGPSFCPFLLLFYFPSKDWIRYILYSRNKYVLENASCRKENSLPYLDSFQQQQKRTFT